MKKIFIILILAILMTSCSTQNDMIQSYTSIEDSIKLLTSTEFDGRRPGTEGNIKTQEYLIKCLEQFDIDSYSESYYWEFPYIIYDINDATIKTDNYNLKYNDDFQIRSTTDSPLNITYSLKSQTTNGEKCILLTEDVKESVDKAKNEDVQAVILNVKDFKNYEYIYEPDIKEKLLIIVQEETYEKLYKSLNSDISINIDIKKQEKTENNIVGIIRADNNPENKAIVISAHFDHIGSYENYLYQGALDNASGVATVLETTKHLIQSLKTEEINKDIIIAFFNLEEEIVKLGGSNKLAKYLENKYDTIVDINFDSIGLNNSKTVVGYNNLYSINDNIVHEIERILIEDSINTIIAEYLTSDHTNFQNGICLYSENQFDVIHTINDTIENIDFSELEKISRKISEYIINLCKMESFVNDDSKELVSIISTTSEKMELGTCKVIEKDGERYHMYGMSHFNELDEFEKMFNYTFSESFRNMVRDDDTLISYNIPVFTELLDFQDDGTLTASDVICNIAELYVKDHELNKVYKKDVGLRDISNIQIETKAVNKFNDNLQTLFHNEYEIDMKSIIDNAEIMIKYNDYDIYYYYNEWQDGKYLSTFKEIGENKYICYMSCNNQNISTEDDIKKVIETNNALAYFETLIEILEH